MTTDHPIAALNSSRAWVKPGRHSFVVFAGLAMATGTIVLVEPAPYDFAFMLLLAAAVLLNRLTFNASHRAPVLLLSCYLLVNLYSMLNARDMRVAIQYNAVSAYLILTWVFFIGFAGYYGFGGVRALLRGYMISGWAVTAVAALVFFQLLPFSGTFLKSGRVQALFKDPNVYGPYIVSVLVFGVAALQWYRIASLRFVSMLAACVLCGVGIFLSFSRAAWINCAISLVFMLGLQLLYGLMKRRIPLGLLRIFVALGLFAVAGGIIGASLPQSTMGLLAERLGQRGMQNYDRDRFETQRRAVAAVSEQPMGVGGGQSEVIFDYSTHSMYIRILTESGAAGFVAFYVFIGWSFLRATHRSLTVPGEVERGMFAAVSACMLGTLINGLVIDTNHWRHLWFLLGLAWWTPPSGVAPGAKI